RRAAFAQQAFILARQSTPFAKCFEPVLISIFINHGGERADLLDAFAWRHVHIAINAQPSPIIQTILCEEAQIRRDVILEPSVDLLGCEVLAVGMSDWNVERLNVRFDAIGDAYASDVALPCSPAAAAISTKPSTRGLGVDRAQADTTQIGELARNTPSRIHLGIFQSRCASVCWRWRRAGTESLPVTLADSRSLKRNLV